MPNAPRPTPLLESAIPTLLEGGLVAAAVTRAGVLVDTSPRFDDVFGLAPGGTRGKPLVALVADPDRERVAGALAAADAGSGGLKVTFEGLRPDGSVFEVELAGARAVIGGAPATVLVATDLSEHRTAKQLSYVAYVDALTGLPNRVLFLERLRETLAASRRDGRIFAVMTGDLDGFQPINESLGRGAGDTVLQVAARRLEGAVRASDTVARLAGDEFAVLLPRLADPADAAMVAGRVLAAFEAPFDVEGSPRQLGISLGIAVGPSEGADVYTLLKNADLAMYESKRAGKNRFTEAPPLVVTSAELPYLRLGDAHAVGVEVVDAQHRALADLVNRLGDDLKAGRERDAVLGSLRALVGCTATHFETEERIMARHPTYALGSRHAQEHRRLLDDVTRLTVDVDLSRLTLTMRFLQEWLLRHIDTMDKPMGAWLRMQDAQG